MTSPQRVFAYSALSSVLLLAPVVLILLLKAQPKSNQGRYEGSTIYKLDGTALSLSSLVKDRPTLLLFVLPTCGHCESELTSLDLLDHEDATGINKVVVAEARGYSRSQLESFAASHACCATYVDKDGVGSRLDVRHVPTMFVLDRKGRLIHTVVGQTNRAYLNSIIAELRRVG